MHTGCHDVGIHARDHNSFIFQTDRTRLNKPDIFWEIIEIYLCFHVHSLRMSKNNKNTKLKAANDAKRVMT